MQAFPFGDALMARVDPKSVLGATNHAGHVHERAVRVALILTDTMATCSPRVAFVGNGVGDHRPVRRRKTGAMSDGSLSDGVVTLRPSSPEDVPLIIAGRDAAFRRFIGEGSVVPRPKYCIVIDGSLVGWVDHDRDGDRWWLAPDEVNIGYHVFPEHRRRGYATRAVALVLAQLRSGTDVGVATLLIHPDNSPSIAIARRHAFERGRRRGGAHVLETTARRNSVRAVVATTDSAGGRPLRLPPTPATRL